MNYKQECSWFDTQRSEKQFKYIKKHPIAYFCAEYALKKNIKTYAGGLGILAGDIVREAADRKVPFVALGLYYHKGYSDNSGKVVKVTVRHAPERVNFKPVLNEKKENLIIRVPIQDHDVLVQTWEFKQGENSVYMLDTNVDGNTEIDREITDCLYVGNKEARLKQEIVLGIGGLRLLEVLKIKPSVYHLNEGHSAMLVFELIRHEIEDKDLTLEEAEQFVKKRVAFTNHTLVSAGYEVYSNDLVSLLLARYANQIKIPLADLVKLGSVQESSMFSMTMLLLRMSGVTSAVSKLHAKKALEIWPDYQMVGITNGIHVKTWDKVNIDVSQVSRFWKKHQEEKAELLSYIKDKTGVKWGRNELLIGWARRFVAYKRPFAVLDDVEEFKKIAQDAGRPVHLVVSGVPHLDDGDGIAMLEKLKSLIKHELSGSVVYLPEYGMELAKKLTAGCDVWLNTPIVGFEACGTSGMKAAINGSLPFSTKDGWVDEVNLTNVGWYIDSDDVTESILATLHSKIVPMYYDCNNSGVPEKWVKYMQNSRIMVMDSFCTARLLREYMQKLYFRLIDSADEKLS